MKDPVPQPIDRIRVEVGDLTELAVDAIVNAANEGLRGGGGVDGAIHRAAGEALLAYTDEHFPNGCATGLAVRTPAFALEARGVKHILHTVGPVWQAGGVMPGEREDEKLGYRMEDNLLASCYAKCLTLCSELKVQRVAFPCISTGVYGFPIERAAKIAFGHVRGWLERQALPEQVVFCCFSEADAAVYREVIETRDQWMYNRRRA